MNDVSVIIVSYHTGPALRLAIDSVLSQPECKELIIVDNGNVPGDVKYLQERCAGTPRMRLVSGQGNVGFARGCNLGAAKATCAWLLFLNPDVMLPECGLARALQGLALYPGNTLAGCFLMNPDGSEQRGGRRELLNPINAISESLRLYRFIKNSPRLSLHNTPMPGTAHEVPAISGSFMLLPRAFFVALGGMDEGYFLHMEDMDFCYRVHSAGGRIICLPDVKVLHFRATSGVASTFVEKHKARGFIRYLRTHYKNKYPKAFFKMMTVAIWLRYALKSCISKMDSIFVPPLAARQEIARLVLLYRLAHFSPQDSRLAGKTILVTGASGQVGLAMVGKALAGGANVVAVYNTTLIDFSHPRLQWVEQDLAANTDVSLLKADALIHTAKLWLLPPLLPQLFDAGLRRIIAFSSTSILSKADSRDKHEQQMVAKLESAESETMRIADDRMRDVTILRPTMIYGAGLDANVTRLADVIRRFGIAPVYGPASGLRQPVQVTDLADAALSIIANDKTFKKTYTLSGGEVLTYRNLLLRLFEYVGKSPRLISLPFFPTILNVLGKLYQLSHVNGEMARRMNRDLAFASNEAAEDFGYHPHAFLEGDSVI